MLPLTVVSATRHDEKDFLERCALGRSLRTYAAFGVKARIFFENTRGLAACYNQAIDETASEDEILVFVHDDVTIADFFWVDKLTLGLSRFDAVGLAGNKRRVVRQPAWHFREISNGQFVWDDREHLSGIVGHGEGFPCAISVYGEVMLPLKLMDGVLLATRRQTFTRNGIRFDERFKFHLYDMDICRQLEEKNLSMGATPLGIIHASVAGFGGPDWQARYRTYLEKWRD
jgi:GT2 family glycosyltransferase